MWLWPPPDFLSGLHPQGLWLVGRLRGGSVGKVSACSVGNCLQCKRHGFDSWVGKILWRRKWLPTPVFLPGKSHEQRSLAGYSPRDCKESATSERLSTSRGTRPSLVALAHFHCVFPPWQFHAQMRHHWAKKVRIDMHTWLSPVVLAGSSTSLYILLFSVRNSYMLSLDPILTSTANIFLSSLLWLFSPCNAKPMPKDVHCIKQLTELKHSYII